MRTLLLLLAISLIASLVDGQTPGDTNWALIIGINNYESLPGLSGAVKGAKLVAETLEQDYGFRRDNVIQLYDGDATRANILNAFDKLSDPQEISPGDRIFVYFAGHAVTRTVGGKELGFIMPVDGVMEKFFSTAISTDQLQVIEQAMPAKQVFFAMDACYGGTVFTRGLGLILPKSSKSSSIQAYTAKEARVALTAGGKNEEVTDMADQGIDAFSYYFLQGLSAGAGIGNQGVITSSALADYVAKNVRYRTSQHPEYGKLPGDDGGEFVFVRSPSSTAETATSPSPGQAPNTVTQNTPPPQPPVEKTSQQEPQVVHPSSVIVNVPALRQFWVYGFLGGNSNSYNVSSSYESFGTKSGGNVGVGVEYLISSNFSLGMNLFIGDDKSGSGTYTSGYTYSFYDPTYGYLTGQVQDGSFTDNIQYFELNPLIKLSLSGAYVDLGPSIGFVTRAEKASNIDLLVMDSYGNSVATNYNGTDKIDGMQTRISLPIGVGYDLGLGNFELFGELRYDIGLNNIQSGTSGTISSVQLLLGAGIGL